MDWPTTSLSVWPDISFVVVLQRMDVFLCAAPLSQQATINRAESRRIRNTPGWAQCKTIFVLNKHMYMTKDFLIESGGPPRRCRVSSLCDFLCAHHHSINNSSLFSFS